MAKLSIGYRDKLSGDENDVSGFHFFASYCIYLNIITQRNDTEGRCTVCITN